MKLLIADDDYQIREGMAVAVDWQSMGIEEVRTAANGKEAMQFFEEFCPEIILADIQMPGMDGLEMVREIRAAGSDAVVIFISAYAKFDYCKEAMRLGANDYILKPLQIEKLENTVRKNLEIYRQSREKAEAYLRVSLSHAIMAYYNEHDESQMGAIIELKKTHLRFTDAGYVITSVLLPDSDTSEWDQKIWMDWERSVHTVFESDNSIILPLINDSIIILFIGNNSAIYSLLLQNQIKDQIDKWNNICGEKFGTVSGGISKSGTWNNLYESYHKALEIGDYRFYHGNGSIYFSQLPDETGSGEFNFTESPSKWKQALDSGSIAGFNELLDRMFRQIKAVKPVPKELERELIRLYDDLCGAYGVPGMKPELEESLMRCRFLTEVQNVFTRFIQLSLWFKLKEDRESHTRYSKDVRFAVDYIMDHYADSVSISEVADVVGKSVNYFGTLFHKETGESFSRMLTRIRLNKARELLLSTNRKVDDICHSVGYTDYVYFSQQFKKEFGCSASEVRKIIR